MLDEIYGGFQSPLCIRWLSLGKEFYFGLFNFVGHALSRWHMGCTSLQTLARQLLCKCGNICCPSFSRVTLTWLSTFVQIWQSYIHWSYDSTVGVRIGIEAQIGSGRKHCWTIRILLISHAHPYSRRSPFGTLIHSKLRSINSTISNDYTFILDVVLFQFTLFTGNPSSKSLGDYQHRMLRVWRLVLVYTFYVYFS